MPKRKQGCCSVRLAVNLRTIRRRRGLSTYDLADRLTGIGWPIHQTGLVRIETGERAVTVDDLLAIAIVLDCSPAALLMPGDVAAPDDSGAVPQFEVVSSQTIAAGPDMWRWAASEAPLILRDQDGGPVDRHLSVRDEVLWLIENRPHRSAELLATLRRA